MASDENFEYFNEVIKGKIAELRADIEKLMAVDVLLGKTATELKKHDILNSMVVLQDVQQTVMDERFKMQELRHTESN